jgi:hypothetical protein
VVKLEQSPDTSPYKIKTPGNHPKNKNTKFRTRRRFEIRDCPRFNEPQDTSLCSGEVRDLSTTLNLTKPHESPAGVPYYHKKVTCSVLSNFLDLATGICSKDHKYLARNTKYLAKNTIYLAWNTKYLAKNTIYLARNTKYLARITNI